MLCFYIKKGWNKGAYRINFINLRGIIDNTYNNIIHFKNQSTL